MMSIRRKGGHLPYDYRNHPRLHQTFRSVSIRCSSIRHTHDRVLLEAVTRRGGGGMSERVHCEDIRQKVGRCRCGDGVCVGVHERECQKGIHCL